MKAFFALVMLLTLNNTYASVEGKVKVLNASYDAGADSINIDVEVSDVCYPETTVRLRGCTDFMFPNTCFLDVTAVGDEYEQGCPSRIQLSFTREELNMKSRRFSNATLIVQNNKGKTRKSVQLPVNR